MPQRRGAGRRERKQPFLTTYQASRLLGVSLPTIVNWIEAGRLSAHRTPGGHRRISREELIRFAREFSYPLPDDFAEQSGPTRILMIDTDRDLSEMVRDYLMMKDGYEARIAGGLFEAGYLLGSFRPRVILLDLGLPGLDAQGVLRTIRGEDSLKGTIVCAVASVRNLRNERLLSAFDGQLEKPLRLDQLLGQITSLLKAR